ncbi:MAG: hypothetical protein JRI73_11555, partial [Deltaproteobacteria bacterium]|nr:hypothetical protein [Deltaproteobacteria bacterium]
FQRAPYQRAAVGLKMRVGQGNLRPCAKNSKAEGAGRVDDLLGRVGTEMPDDVSAMFLFPLPGVAERLVGNVVKLL